MNYIIYDCLKAFRKKSVTKKCGKLEKGEINRIPDQNKAPKIFPFSTKPVTQQGEENMKKFVTGLAMFLILLVAAPMAFAAPWVYPASEVEPTKTEYWVTPLSEGTNYINLVLWNHANKDSYVKGMFVIAIKSGVNIVTIDSVKIAGTPKEIDTQDLSGATTPGHPFPKGEIFPCPWMQYEVVDLEGWKSPQGWQGTDDPSGVSVEVQVTVKGNPAQVQLYFLSYGYDQGKKGDLKATDTPYSHITQTYSTPFVVPESSLGALTALAAALLAFALYSQRAKIRKLRKNKPQEMPR